MKVSSLCQILGHVKVYTLIIPIAQVSCLFFQQIKAQNHYAVIRKTSTKRDICLIIIEVTNIEQLLSFQFVL